MILQLQAKVHVLGNLGVLTTTYAILSLFKDPFFPPFHHDKFLYSRSYSGSRADYDDKLARVVVVCCVCSVICLLCFAGLASVVWLA